MFGRNNMNLVAEHNGILARLREDLPDVGWYLYITLPSGESRDHLQDTKELAITQAEDDYNIPPSAWQVTEVIYVYLLNEGTDVWRPIDAVPMADGLYRIPQNIKISEDEDWQFVPGTTVRCSLRRLSGGDRLIAVEVINQNKTEQCRVAHD
jgi:hypothetical protein